MQATELPLDPPRVKLLHVLATLEAGGAERFAVSLVCELRRRGWDIGLLAVASQTDPAGRRMAADLAEGGVETLIGPTAAIRLRAALWYVRSMRRIRPELVHLHTPNTETLQMFVPPPWRPRRGLVRTLHGTNLAISDMHVFALRRSEVACTVFCSEASREGNQGWVRGPSRVIPNGVRSDLEVRGPERTKAAKARLGLDPRQVHFLHVGNMAGSDPTRAAKAHDVMLRAWRESGVGAEGAVFHLLGNGELRPRIEALAAGDASVRLHGVSGDTPDWLLGADAFVMASRYEGLPIAGIEALCVGLPCLFTRIAPLEELRPPVALWSDVDDAAGLAQNLREFARTRPEPDPAAALAARERFGIGRAADGYEEVYRSLQLAPEPAG